MNTNRRCPPLARLALLLTLAPLAACATNEAPADSFAHDADGPVGVWSPHARARFVTLDRSTTYTIVRQEGTDLIIVEEGIDGAPANGPDRFVWIVSLPDDAEYGTPLDYPGLEESAESPGGAWLLEYRRGLNTRAQPASGRVEVLSRTDAAITAQLDLAAPGAPLAPGQLGDNTIVLAARLDLPRYRPLIPGTVDPETRSGVDGLRDPDPTTRTEFEAN